MITIMMVPLAVVIISYALFTFYMRSKFMERKQVSRPALLLWVSFLWQAFWPVVAAPVWLPISSPAEPHFSSCLQVGFYQDWVGAAVIASLVMSMLVVILGVAVHELIAS